MAWCRLSKEGEIYHVVSMVFIKSGKILSLSR